MGLYAPIQTLEIRQQRTKAVGYAALTQAFSELALHKNSYVSLKKVFGNIVPADYAKNCFIDVTESPLPGLHGYISIKNASPNDMVVTMQVELRDADIVYPDKATKTPIQAAIQSNENELYIFRRQELSEFGHKISLDFVPRRLDEEELDELIKKENPTNKGLGKA